MRPASIAGLATAGALAVLLRRMSPADSGREADVPPAEPRFLADFAAWVPPEPQTSAGRLAVRLWAAPLSITGIALGVSGMGRPHIQQGVVVFTDVRGAMGVTLRRRGFAATTLGHVMVTTRRAPSASLVTHELVHTRQAERLGIAFGPVYVGLLAWYGYRQHPMERAARLGAGASPT